MEENVKSLGQLMQEHMAQSSRENDALPVARLVLSTVERYMDGKQGAAIVYPWAVAPAEFKALSRHGGDEDYVIIHRGETGAYWSYKLAVCDEQITPIGDNIYVTITAHS